MLRVTLLIFLILITGPLVRSQSADEVYDLLGERRYQKAISNVQDIISIAKGNKLGELYYLEGYAHEQLNSMGLAMNSYLNANKHLKDQGMRLRVQNNIGVILYELEFYNKASPYFNHIIQSTTRTSEEHRYGYYNRSRVELRLEQTENAKADIDRTIELSLASGDTSLYLKALNFADLIKLAADEKNFEEFNHSKLLQLNYEASDNATSKKVLQVNARRSLHNIAKYFLAKHDTATALLKYEEALKLSVQSYHKFITLKDMAEVQIGAGHRDEAYNALTKAISIVEETDLLDKANNIKVFSLIASMETNVTKKVSLLEQATRLYERYTTMKEEVDLLNEQNMAALAWNSHFEIKDKEEKVSNLTILLVGFILVILLIAVYLYKKNKALLGDVTKLTDLLLKQSSSK